MVLLGKLVVLKEGSADANKARRALYSRHPAMKAWPTGKMNDLAKDLRNETISTVMKRVTKCPTSTFVCAFQFLFYKMTNIGSWEVSNCNFFIYCCS